MNEYTVTFTRSARRELAALDQSAVRRIYPRIEALGSNPRPRGCIKLRGREDLWRIRISDYRVVYAIDDETRVVDIIAVGPRSDVYR